METKLNFRLTFSRCISTRTWELGVLLELWEWWSFSFWPNVHMAHNDILAGQRFMDMGDFPTCEGHEAASGGPSPQLRMLNTKY